MGEVPSVVCAETVIACDASTLASSWITIVYAMWSMPAPPSSSGQGTPSSPSSAIRATFAHGNSEFRSSSAATGAISLNTAEKLAPAQSQLYSYIAPSTNELLADKGDLWAFVSDTVRVHGYRLREARGMSDHRMQELRISLAGHLARWGMVVCSIDLSTVNRETAMATQQWSRGEVIMAMLDRLTRGAPNRMLIFDSPPALAASPAAELAKHVGQALVVVRADTTGQAALEDALSLLSDCPDIRLLLNAALYSPSGRRFGTYYGYAE